MCEIDPKIGCITLCSTLEEPNVGELVQKRVVKEKLLNGVDEDMKLEAGMNAQKESLRFYS